MGLLATRGLRGWKPTGGPPDLRGSGFVGGDTEACGGGEAPGRVALLWR